eukprot:1016177-Amphidinium_carterae.1
MTALHCTPGLLPCYKILFLFKPLARVATPSFFLLATDQNGQDGSGKETRIVKDREETCCEEAIVLRQEASSHLFHARAAKKVRALMVKRRPTTRDPLYTKCRPAGPPVRRRTLSVHTAGHGVTEQSDRRCAAQLRRVGLLPPPKTWSTCGGQLTNTVEGDAANADLNLKSWRCASKGCQKRYSVFTDHPFLAKEWHAALALQANAHNQGLNIGAGHATIERFAARLRIHLREYVLNAQKKITYGHEGVVEELECDEVTISKYASGNPRAPVAWVGHVGIVVRGAPGDAEAHQNAHQRDVSK